MSASSRTCRRIISSAMLGVLLCSGGAITAGAVTAQARIGAAPHVVYTPVDLRRHLTRSPAAWLGRVVWVRARPVRAFVWTCQHDYLCVIRQPSLADPTVDAADARLPLALPAQNPILARARHVPVVGPMIAWLAPAPTIAWGRVGLYHIQLVAPPSCADATCVVAQLTATA